jgi:carboxypeptidase family protein
MSSIRTAVVALVCSLTAHGIVPADVFAQGATLASITGLVRDASGGVLPGVTVEATSPALIERVRTAVTDGTGRYRIVNLPPGVYDVTFTLTGFRTVIREGLELSGSFTANVGADLQVGSLEETITVSGEAPIVDVQNAQRQQVIDSQVIAAIPANRSFEHMAALVPGIQLSTSSQNVGGINGPVPPFFGGHGGSQFEGRLRMDGIGTGGATGGVSLLIVDTGNAAEITISTTGGLADAEIGGPEINVVPRTGGNTFSGQLFFAGAGGAMQSDNFTQELKGAGVRAGSELKKVWDVNLAAGGPVKRDRLWFFATTRTQGSYVTNADTFFNKNAGDPTKWTYEPDLSRQSETDGVWKNSSLRLTWQASARNKLTVFWDEQTECRGCKGGGSPTVSPEASAPTDVPWMRAYQAVWTAPLSSRLLAEAAFSGMGFSYGREKEGNDRNLIKVTDQVGPITYRSMDWRPAVSFTPRYRASLSYVSGAHNMKVGFDQMHNISDRTWHTNLHGLEYRFSGGRPNRLTMILNDFKQEAEVRGGAAYAQDQWTLGRLTTQGGLRFDWGSSSSPEQTVGPNRWIPNAIVFPAQKLVRGHRDISLRGGMALDVFGTGTTSLKINAGRYVDPVQWSGIYVDTNPTSANVGPGTPPQTNRSWNDLNSNYVPDCDLLNPFENAECGTMENTRFGQGQTPSTTYDDALLGGWGVRQRNYQFGVSVQQAVLPRVSMEVGYHRRWFPEFTATDNRAVTPADYSPYSITAPSHERLPGGGGYVINDLYEISEGAFGRTDDFVTQAETFGDAGEYWHGVDVHVNARLTNGLTVQGGTSTGRRVRDRCDLVVDNPSTRNCQLTLPFLSDVRGLVAYSIPKIDVQVSATMQSRPGPELVANLTVPSAVVAQTLGRPLSGRRANVIVNVLNPGELYGDRITQIDFRVGKILRFGRTRSNVGIDFYNVTNSSVPLTYNSTYGATWLRPTAFMPARFVKLTGQFSF